MPRAAPTRPPALPAIRAGADPALVLVRWLIARPHEAPERSRAVRRHWPALAARGARGSRAARDEVARWILAVGARTELGHERLGAMGALLAGAPPWPLATARRVIGRLEARLADGRWAGPHELGAVLGWPVVPLAVARAFLDRVPPGREFAMPWHTCFGHVAARADALDDPATRRVLARHPGQYVTRALALRGPGDDRLPHVLRLLALYQPDRGRAVKVLRVLRDLAREGPLTAVVPGLAPEHLADVLAGANQTDREEALLLLARL